MHQPNFLGVCFLSLITLTTAVPQHAHTHQRRDDSTTLSSSAAVASTTFAATSTTNSKSQFLSSSSNSQDTDSEVTITVLPSTLSFTKSTASSAASSTVLLTSSASTLVQTSTVVVSVDSPSSTSIPSVFNTTIKAGQLPIEPKITPGLAVGGILLILSGLAYTLLGIRSRTLHVFLSSCYLASLGVTVLIIYIMNPPISNSVQGAYVVAIALTGAIIGGASIVFIDITEGLGCLLGGFCFSMWLLVLKPGGLLTSTSAISCFVSAFTIAAFATSFTHYTRAYALIVFISFAGATIIVLGIDCFSRAGLKEFWAYIWNLNSNLIPLGVTTYPLTRGLKVEIASIIVIFLAGIISQMQLWKVVQEHREVREAERLRDEEAMERREEKVGRRIQRRDAAQRAQWEAIYGDGAAARLEFPHSVDSGLPDMENQKKSSVTASTSIRSGEDDIEMSDMSSRTTITANQITMPNAGPINAIKILVSEESDVPKTLNPTGPKPEFRLSQLSEPAKSTKDTLEPIDAINRISNEQDISAAPVKSPVPEVVPLPFKLPEIAEDDDRSSVATVADDDVGNRRPVSKRFSATPALKRGLSLRSHRSSKRYSRCEGVSTEDLVSPQADNDDGASSIGATLDDLSDDEDLKSGRASLTYSPLSDDARKSVVSAVIVDDAPPKEVTTDTERSNGFTRGESEKSAPEQTPPEISEDPQPKAVLESDSGTTTNSKTAPHSIPLTVSSPPLSLTKERLPPQLSKVVMSYRTNEWAKHLSEADAPAVDNLQVGSHSQPKSSNAEASAPVHFDELQQTAENGKPPPIQRTFSHMSSRTVQPPSRSNSALSKMTPLAIPMTRNNSSQSISTSPVTSSQGLAARGLRSSSTPFIAQPIVESPVEDKFPGLLTNPTIANNAYSNASQGQGTTLVSRPEHILRNKASFTSYNGLSSSQESHRPESQYRYSRLRALSAHGQFNQRTSTIIDDDDISLSARRELIRQSSLQQLSMHASANRTSASLEMRAPSRQKSIPIPADREQQLAMWRASVQQGLQSTAAPIMDMDLQRQALWHERQTEMEKRDLNSRMKDQLETAFDHRMRSGDMMDAHKKVMRRMQAEANRHAQ